MAGRKEKGGDPKPFVVASEVLLPVMATNVWTLLTDFDRYPEWAHSVRISGQAVVGQQLECRMAYLGGRRDHWIKFSATVQIVETGRTLVWGLSAPGLVDAQFTFTLIPWSGSVRLRYEARVTGLAARVERARYEAFLGLAVRGLTSDVQGVISANRWRRPKKVKPSPTEPSARSRSPIGPAAAKDVPQMVNR